MEGNYRRELLELAASVRAMNVADTARWVVWRDFAGGGKETSVGGARARTGVLNPSQLKERKEKN